MGLRLVMELLLIVLLMLEFLQLGMPLAPIK